MNRRLVCVLALVTALLAWPAVAQKKEKENPNERSVIGVVLDAADSPIEGAVVQLKNLKTLEIRSFITRADGRYHFHSLKTEIDYELRAKAGDKFSNTRLLSTFDGRKQPSMNLKIEK